MKASQRDQLLIYLAVKLAKIDAVTSSFVPLLVIALAGGATDSKSCDALAQKVDLLNKCSAVAQGPTLTGNFAHLIEQFPECQKTFDDTFALCEKEILDASAKVVQLWRDLNKGDDQKPH